MHRSDRDGGLPKYEKKPKDLFLSFPAQATPDESLSNNPGQRDLSETVSETPGPTLLRCKPHAAPSVVLFRQSSHRPAAISPSLSHRNPKPSTACIPASSVLSAARPRSRRRLRSGWMNQSPRATSVSWTSVLPVGKACHTGLTQLVSPRTSNPCTGPAVLVSATTRRRR